MLSSPLSWINLWMIKMELNTIYHIINLKGRINIMAKLVKLVNIKKSTAVMWMSHLDELITIL